MNGLSFLSVDGGLLLLRLGVGLSLAGLHGWSKLSAAAGFLFQGQEWKFIRGVEELGFPMPVFFAVAAALAESLGSLGIAFGFLTRYSAAAVASTMLVAIYRHVSAGQGFELAALYLIPALGIALTGPGKYALDPLLARVRRPLDAESAEKAREATA
jgi:putative oxidoreductase